MSNDELNTQEQSSFDSSNSNEISTNVLLERVREKEATYTGMWLALGYSSSFEVIGGIVGVLIITIASITGFISISPDGSYDFGDPNTSITLLIINALATLIMGLFFLIFNIKSKYIPNQTTWKINKRDSKLLLIGFSLMFFLIAGTEVIVSIILDRFYPEMIIETPYDFFSSDNLVVLIIAFLSVVIVAPIVEEIFYRWTMIETFSKGMSKYSTIIFSALIFAFAHSLANLSSSFFFFTFHLISTLIMGIIFGALYYQTRKVILPIILHAVWNLIVASGSFFDYFGVYEIYNIIYYVLIGLGALGTIIFSALFIYEKIKNKEPKIKQPIKLKGEWFVLGSTYFGLIVLIPILIENITEYVNFGQGLITLFYLGVLMFISAFFASKKIAKKTDPYQLT